MFHKVLKRFTRILINQTVEWSKQTRSTLNTPGTFSTESRHTENITGRSCEDLGLTPRNIAAAKRWELDKKQAVTRPPMLNHQEGITLT